tara:strand:- start:1227 stop:1538 length:312 start_codon:yes stop_codon:yes gene_type:complete
MKNNFDLKSQKLEDKDDVVLLGEVNHPPHYTTGKIECIEAIEAMLTPEEYIGYLRGNSLKYRWRFRYKQNPLSDLLKAQWYEERLLTFYANKLTLEKADGQDT